MFAMSTMLKMLTLTIILMLTIASINAQNCSPRYYETIRRGGPSLPSNEVISSYRIEGVAIRIKCFTLCYKEPKCVGFNYRITTFKVENCQLTNVTKKRDTATSGDWALLRDIEA
ncbi:Hypothetical predicted protein, partial [Paramuricea clavata]